ncbi:MAG: HAD-IIA family hydrolase [Actinomycetota bacterium]
MTIGDYDAFVIDLDGVVWRGDLVLPGVIEALTAIRQKGAAILLLTNNPHHSPESVVERLGALGFELQQEEVLNTLGVVRDVLTEQGLVGKPTLVLGPDEIEGQLRDWLAIVDIGTPPDVVIAGRYVGLTYSNLALASDAIREGAFFIALNRDPVLPVEHGYLPGAGAIIAALEVASGVAPLVIGKPYAPMMNAARSRVGQRRVLMIGDRTDTDIAGAITMGWDSVLVGAYVDGPRPTFQVDSLAEAVSMDTTG